MATSFHQELELLRKEMQEQMNTMSRRHDREMRSLKKENIKILDDVDALRSKNDSLELELAQTKKLLKAEVESLRRQSSPSLHQTATTSAPGATAHSQSSKPIGTAGPSSVKMTTHSSSGESALFSLISRTITGAFSSSFSSAQRILETSQFSVHVDNPRRLDYNSPTTPVRVDSYDTVFTDSKCMDVRTGVYTTPYGGSYRFRGGVGVWGNGSISMFVCGSDGRRKMVVGTSSVWKYDEVFWDCPKDMTVWMEVVGDSDCDRDTRFKAWFDGGL